MLPALLLAAAATATPPPQPCQTEARTAEVRAIRKRLFALPEPGDNDMPYMAPAGGEKDIPDLRIALGETITEFMKCDAGVVLDPAVLQSRLAGVLGVDPNQHEASDSADDHAAPLAHTWGDGLTLKVAIVPRMKDTISVDVSFVVGCGDDHTLLLFQRAGEGWQPILNWHSEKFTQDSDAFGDFFSFTAVPGPDGAPLMLVAHGTPWCSSNMSGFAVDLLQPGVTQKPLAHFEREYRRYVEDVSLRPTEDGAELDVDADSRDIDNMMTYPAEFRFRTTEGKLERLPQAKDPRAFLEAWWDESWDLAAKWVSSPTAGIEDVHKRFGLEEKTKEYEAEEAARAAAEKNGETVKEAPSAEFSYGPVRACRMPRNVPHSPRRLQVEVDLDTEIPNDPDNVERETLFAVMEQDGNSYRLLAFRGEPLKTCNGPDLTPKDDDLTPPETPKANAPSSPDQ